MTLLLDRPADAPPEEPDTEPADDGRGWVARHRLVLVALVLVVLFHGSLLLAGSYQRTYDAYVHIFFADHYARDWFSTWDDRWYTGFATVSYPPGSHQAVAAVSLLLGLRTGFVVVQLAALLLLTVGVYRWSRIWVDQVSAGWASIALVLASSIAETVHVFGQLPTTLSLGFLLNALPFADRWVRHGDRRALVLGTAATMATTACHHVTTLFGAVFFVGPVLLAGVVAGLRTPVAGEPDGHPARVRAGLVWPLVARRLRRVLPSLLRAGVFGACLLVALVTVVLPYWLFSRSDPITQVSIPHASRDSFLVNLNAGLVFWLVPWGTTLLVLPYALVRGLGSRAWPLAVSLAGMAFLGTGGTTPVPKLLLGGAFDILTLDRFTFWATICVLPLVGRFVSSVVGGTVRAWLVANVGRTLSVVLPVLLLAAHLGTTLLAANLTHYRPFQPRAIDVAPITAFLDKDDHSRWRYLTLGFGDQMAWLGANTTAQTVDGNYHSARALPELTSRPVERLENAKYAGVPGIGSLQQFLAVPERYSLKYVFSIDQFYAPLLDASGWKDLGPLENGVEVWERADVAPLPATSLARERPVWQRAMWGTVPPGSILLALTLLGWYAVGGPTPRRPRWLHLPARLRRTRRRRLVGWVDARLARAAARVPTAGAAPAGERWLPGRPLLRRLRALARRPVAPRRRRTQAALVVAALVLGLLGGVVLARGEEPGPEAVLTAYYDHLDFRRLSDAYALLDPATRPDLVQYQLDTGADGGLVASFAKLSSVRTTVLEQTPDRAVVLATRTFLTSVQSYDVPDTVTLVRTAAGWRVELAPVDPSQPPDQFSSRAGVDFLSQGRRAPTSGATSTADVLDRPQLTLDEVRSLRVGQRWVVVGEVTNIDVDPADVTVTAQLRDPAGALLASWDASQVAVHTLLPGQRTPFRVELQSIAGTGAYGTEVDGGVVDGGDGTATATPVAPTAPARKKLDGPVEFDPQVITPLTLADGAQVASVGVYAKAVVTPRTPPPGLQVVDAHLEGDELVGTLRNDATVEASVPHLLLSYLDAAGRLGWVDHSFLEHSVGPQRETTFRVRLRPPDGLRDADVPTEGYAGPAHAPLAAPPPLLALPPGGAFTGLDVTATAYVRTAGS